MDLSVWCFDLMWAGRMSAVFDFVQNVMHDDSV